MTDRDWLDGLPWLSGRDRESEVTPEESFVDWPELDDEPENSEPEIDPMREAEYEDSLCCVCGQPAPWHEDHRRALHDECVGEYLWGE